MRFEIEKNIENESGVYKIITDVDFNKVYVGSAVNLKKRFFNHLSDLKRGVHKNTHLQNHFNKHGDLSFRLVGLSGVASLLELEQLVLDEYSVIKEVFNVNKSCDRSRLGLKHTEGSKKKMSDKLKGRVGTRLGVKYDDELRKKLSIAHTGLPSPIKGIKRTPEHRAAIKAGLDKRSDAEKRLQGERRSPKMKKYWALNKKAHIENRLKNKPQCKWVVQCDVDGNDIKEFHGVKFAASELGINKNGISQCLKGNRKTAGGFKWRYK